MPKRPARKLCRGYLNEENPIGVKCILFEQKARGFILQALPIHSLTTYLRCPSRLDAIRTCTTIVTVAKPAKDHLIQKDNLKAKLSAVLFVLIISSSCSEVSSAQPLTIAKRVNGSTLSVSIDPKVHAGAINSLIYRGVQYVNNHDHGRQIQTALQVDNLGECFNPTEAGSKADGASRRTSSTVRSASNTGNILTTETRPAFWLAPQEPYGKACSPHVREASAQNRVILSDYTIRRTTRFYGAAIPNLLIIDVKISVPELRKSASVEALTAYLPKTFDTFYSYDPRSRRSQRLKAGPDGGRTSAPIIIATRDGQHAMGVFSPRIARSPLNQAYYAYFYFAKGGATAKWSCVFAEPQIRAGAVLNYSCPVAVGTLEEVKSAFAAYGAVTRP